MKFLLLLSLIVIFMATETEQIEDVFNNVFNSFGSGNDDGQVEDAFRIVFNSMDSDNDGTISSSDMGDISSFRDSSHKDVCNLFGPPFQNNAISL